MGNLVGVNPPPTTATESEIRRPRIFHLGRCFTGWLSLLCFLLVLVPWPAAGATTPMPPAPNAPQMPDESHRLLAAHAAQSHGLVGDLVAWISQGAYDEDHCEFEPYPPCSPWIPSGWHSWDPDTDQYWTEPSIWADFGSGLVRAGQAFDRAVDAAVSGDDHAAHLYLGRVMHLLGDMATPAHAHLDTHLPPFDSDPYELWLNADELANTHAWIDPHPPGPGWDLSFQDLSTWAELSADLQGQLGAASQVYGGRNSGQELWQHGPEGHDVVIFRLMFLMAEEADNWDSDDVQGEQYPGDLDDPAYLIQMRDTLFPRLVPYSAALIDYFEYRTSPRHLLFLPMVVR
jgi:hypothetical protein